MTGQIVELNRDRLTGYFRTTGGHTHHVNFAGFELKELLAMMAEDEVEFGAKQVTSEESDALLAMAAIKQEIAELETELRNTPKRPRAPRRMIQERLAVLLAG